jgi:hypothetical protein
VILPTDIPTRAEIDRLLEYRAPWSVSIYLPTAPASWLSGARVLAVRESDIPGGSAVAAILRYPL